jgi:hypothetical protein
VVVFVVGSIFYPDPYASYHKQCLYPPTERVKGGSHYTIYIYIYLLKARRPAVFMVFFLFTIKNK